MKDLLVFGQRGQVARELARLAPKAKFVGRSQVDLTHPGACGRLIETLAPAAILNAAAYTTVDRAEAEQDLVRKTNAEAPAEMAAAAARLGIPFIHISTDYVFDGSGDRAWSETDVPAPLNVYGSSKLAGEQAVAQCGGCWAVIRTSWVFSAHGSNFVKTMLRLGAERDCLSIVADQVGGPTPARDIAKAALRMAVRMATGGSEGGIYHLSGAPDVSWADFAREIFKQARLDCQVQDIATAQYPTPARRPLNSRLECGRIDREFGIPRPDWRDGLRAVLNQLKEIT